MSDPAPPAPAPAAPTKGLSGGKVVLLVAGVNLLATAGLAAVVLLRPGTVAAPPAPTAEAAAAPAAGEHGAAAGEHAAAPAAGEHGAAPAAEKAPAEGEHGAAPAAEGHAKPEATASTGDMAATTARIEDLVIHLRNPEVDRYARLTIDVEMERSDELDQLKENIPRVRDAVIMTLCEHTFEELRGAEGLTRMKSWLRDAIDGVVPGQVKAVYVSAFLVQ
jgi:flagellar basal body-associated protein FliL